MDPKKARSSVAYSVHAKMNFRVIVVGDSAVGKTSLIIRYVKGVFNKNKTYVASIGVEFYSKMMEIEGEEVAIQVWDTVLTIIIIGRTGKLQIHREVVL